MSPRQFALCSAISLFYFKIFQTIIWPWNKPYYRENEDDNFCCLVFKISKLSMNMKLDQNSNLWNFLQREFIENLQKMLSSHIHISRFHQTVFEKFHRSQILWNFVIIDSLESWKPGQKKWILNCRVKQQNCRAKSRAKVLLVQLQSVCPFVRLSVCPIVVPRELNSKEYTSGNCTQKIGVSVQLTLKLKRFRSFTGKCFHFFFRMIPE